MLGNAGRQQISASSLSSLAPCQMLGLGPGQNETFSDYGHAAYQMTLHTPLTSAVGIQIAAKYFYWTKHVDTKTKGLLLNWLALVMTWMIPKVDLGVEEMGFLFCDLLFITIG